MQFATFMTLFDLGTGVIGLASETEGFINSVRTSDNLLEAFDSTAALRAGLENLSQEMNARFDGVTKAFINEAFAESRDALDYMKSADLASDPAQQADWQMLATASAISSVNHILNNIDKNLGSDQAPDVLAAAINALNFAIATRIAVAEEVTPGGYRDPTVREDLQEASQAMMGLSVQFHASLDISVSCDHRVTLISETVSWLTAGAVDTVKRIEVSTKADVDLDAFMQDLFLTVVYDGNGGWLFPGDIAAVKTTQSFPIGDTTIDLPMIRTFDATTANGLKELTTFIEHQLSDKVYSDNGIEGGFGTLMETATGYMQLSMGADHIGDNLSETVSGTGADDYMLGKGGNDALNGLGGDDYIDGGTGSDRLDGGDGDDELLGGAGNDSLDGGRGMDILEGGAGTDVLTGGAGGDVFIFRGDDGGDTIRDFDHEDLIGLDVLGYEGLAGGIDDATFAALGEDLTSATRLFQTEEGLYYDSDGSGAAKAELVATFADSFVALTQEDIALFG